VRKRSNAIRSKTFSLLSVIAISAMMIMGSYIPSSALIYPPADPPILLSIEGSSCVSVFEGVWNGVDTCTIDEGFSVGDNFDVEISPGVTAVLLTGESIIINDSEFTINDGATLIIQPGAYLIINNGGTLIDSGTLILNSGNIEINDGGTLQFNGEGSLIMNDSSILDEKPGGKVKPNPVVLTPTRPAITVLFSIDRVIEIGGIFDITGDLDINGGVLNINDGGSLNIDDGGFLNINNGGDLNVASGGVLTTRVGGIFNIACLDASAQATGVVDAFVVLSCGSIIENVFDGTADTTFVAGDGRTATTTIDAGNELTFDPDTFTFTAPDTNSDTIIVNVGGLEIPLVPDSNIKPVNIDVKPGVKSPATINLKIEKTIAVAILGDVYLDVSQIDRTLSTLKFGDSLSATPATAIKTSLKDVNLDGKMDLVAHFKLSQTNLSLGDTMGCLKGKMKETFGGATIEGCDTIRLV